jgi:hypothetical protein
VGNFVVPGIRDTQAGFKVFKKESAHQLFPLARTKRFLFDLEILVIAKEHHCKIEKVYVDWQDRDGSTVRIFIDTLRSLRDLVLIYTRMLFGAYKVEREELGSMSKAVPARQERKPATSPERLVLALIENAHFEEALVLLDELESNQEEAKAKMTSTKAGLDKTMCGSTPALWRSFWCRRCKP